MRMAPDRLTVRARILFCYCRNFRFIFSFLYGRIDGVLPGIYIAEPFALKLSAMFIEDLAVEPTQQHTTWTRR